MSTSQEGREEARLQKRHQAQRATISKAYASILGESLSESFLAFSFEDAVDMHLALIEGDLDPNRVNELERVTRLENQLLEAVRQLKQVPPEQFLRRDPERDANTSQTA